MLKSSNDAHLPIWGFWLIVIATILLTLKGIFAKLAYQQGAGIDATLLLRFYICLPLMWGIFYARKNTPIRTYLNKNDLMLIISLSFLGYYLASKFDYSAIFYLGAGLSRMVIFSYPLFVILLNALYLRSYPQKSHIILGLLIQIGLVMAISGGNITLFELNLRGGLFAVTCALAYALHLVILTHKGKHLASGTLVTMMLSLSTFYITVDFILTNEFSELLLNWQAYFWITMMAIFSTALPIALFIEGVKRIGSNESSLISSFGPIFGLMLAWLLLGERYNLTQIYGSMLIVFCITLLGRKMRKNKSSR